MRPGREADAPPAGHDQGPLARLDGPQRHRRRRLLEHRLPARELRLELAIRTDGPGQARTAQLRPAAVLHQGIPP